MLLTSIPLRIPIIFASAAPGGDVTDPFPSTAQTGGLASLPTGFVHANFTAISGGGIPPWGKDANGILKLATAWEQWAQAGAPIGYDATFSTAIGGYPNGAIIASATGPGLGWLSTVDNNTSNPDAAGANWRPVVYAASSNRLTASLSVVYSGVGNPNGFVAGTAGIVAAPDLYWDTLNHVLWACITSGNAASAVWIAINSPTGTSFPSHSVILGTGGVTFSSVGPNGATGIPFLSNGPGSDPNFGALDLGGPGVTGTAPVIRGGTGRGSFSPNSIPLGSGPAALGEISSAVPDGYVLTAHLLSPPTFDPPTASRGLGGMLAFTFNGNFTVPAGVTVLKVERWDGGGGGGGTIAGNGSGGGGGGGGYRRYYVSVTPSAVMPVVVGAGGVGGSPGGNGADGSASSFGGSAGDPGRGGQAAGGGSNAAGGNPAGAGSIPGNRGAMPGTFGTGGGTFGISDKLYDITTAAPVGFDGPQGNYPAGGGCGAQTQDASSGNWSGGAGRNGLVIIEW